jgi:hypothetical protein
MSLGEALGNLIGSHAIRQGPLSLSRASRVRRFPPGQEPHDRPRAYLLK